MSSVGKERERAHILEHELGTINIRLVETDIKLHKLQTVTYNGALYWKISGYTKKKADAISGKILSFFSEPFHTSHGGYKLCGRIYLDGNGTGKLYYIYI